MPPLTLTLTFLCLRVLDITVATSKATSLKMKEALCFGLLTARKSVYLLCLFDNMNTYTTKATWLGHTYGCRVFFDGKLIVEGRVPDRRLIGAVFRDLLRTLDKLGGDQFTYAARNRKFAEQAPMISVKHIWYT